MFVVQFWSSTMSVALVVCAGAAQPDRGGLRPDRLEVFPRERRHEPRSRPDAARGRRPRQDDEHVGAHLAGAFFFAALSAVFAAVRLPLSSMIADR